MPKRLLAALTLVSVAAIVVVVARQTLNRAGAAPESSKGQAMVKVHVYNAEGKLVGPIEMPKVVKTDEEWKKQLTPEQFRVARSSGTERPFCGNLLDNKKEGVYTCICCGLPLFSSNSKFNSGTGWPSFFQAVSKENVTEKVDDSHGMKRVEINCGRCDGHLGHVFEDGPRPTGLRFCVNSESLAFTEAKDLAKLADPAANAPATKPAAAHAVFAGGCFWCTEAVFEQIDGVSEVVSGYAGGDAKTANYKDVCNGDTGHAEVIQITYDPAKVSYKKLLEIHFASHDPTQLNRQGPDTGTQYRSAVFYESEEQKKAAEAYIAGLQPKYSQKIVTTLEPLKKFYPAEEYHQDFAKRNPQHGYIKQQSAPKVEKVKKLFPDEVKK